MSDTGHESVNSVNEVSDPDGEEPREEENKHVDKLGEGEMVE
jgi:hypothetical protein